METYIVLFNYTEQGIKDMKNTPSRVAAAKAATEAAGGRWLGWYMTMGRYDGLVITEAPNATAAAAVVMATGMQGNVKTETLRAFTLEEVTGLIGNMP